MAPRTRTRATLVGIGLDNQDGHKRITTGENFAIVGGSEETHARMTETSIKTSEELKRRGLSLETIEAKRLAEIVERNRPT